MRKTLATHAGEWAIFRGTFERFGTFKKFLTKNGWQRRPGQTLLLKNICDETGTQVCEYLWLNCTRAFALLNLQPGDTVEFEAQVKEYFKGYVGKRAGIFTPIDVNDPLFPAAAGIHVRFPGGVRKPIEIDYKLSQPTWVKKVVP